MPDAPKTAGTDRPMAMALGLVFQLGLMIAIPVFIFGLGGAYLDRHLDTSPYLVLAGFGLAALISTVSVRAKVRVIINEYKRNYPPRQNTPVQSAETSDRQIGA